MEKDIQDALGMLRCVPECLTDKEVMYILSNDELSSHFIKCCVWICDQLKDYCSLEETVSEQEDTFQLDMSGFLREMDCPYLELIGIDALNTDSNRLLLLDYLLSELMACRIVGGFQDNENESSGNPILKPIYSIMKALQMPPPSNKESVSEVFRNIQKRASELLPPEYLGVKLLSKKLDVNQWAKVEKINDILSDEYHIRRQMLLKRIDVTIQSFLWSDKGKSNRQDLIASFDPIRARLSAGTSISTADVLAATTDLCKFEKTSSGEAREVTKCDVNKVLIGGVPDRGGRLSAEAPAPDMPRFSKRTEAPKDQRGNRRGGARNFNRGGFVDRGGGRGGGEGGRGDGGWSRSRAGGGRGGGGWKNSGRGNARGNDDGRREGGFGNDKIYYS